MALTMDQRPSLHMIRQATNMVFKHDFLRLFRESSSVFMSVDPSPW